MHRFSDMRMACLGDSLTLGQGIQHPYSSLVKEILSLKEVYNYGIGWSTIADGKICRCHPGNYSVGHTPFIDRYHMMNPAEIIAVCGGANDHAVNVPLGSIHDMVRNTFYGALNILITGLKENNPDSYIFFMTPFHYDTINDNGIQLSVYANAVKTVCEKFCIDCYDCYHEIPINVEKDTLDGTHPTQEFVNSVWGPGIVQYISDKYVC